MKAEYKRCLLFLYGLIITVNGVPIEDINKFTPPEEPIPERVAAVKPSNTEVKVKDLNEDQNKIFCDINPKMIERTKITDKVYKVEGHGEEKIRTIYRTRLIGQFDPKVLSNLKTIENVLDSLDDNENVVFSSKTELQSPEGRKKQLTDIDNEFNKALNSEMPVNQHSAKKELQDNTITMKSSDIVAPNPTLHKESTVDVFKPQSTPSIFKKVDFVHTKEDEVKPTVKEAPKFDSLEDENETMFKQPVNPFHKVNFVDSLELYKNQEQKRAQALDELKAYVNSHLFHVVTHPPVKPLLQRQFSVYENPVPNQHSLDINKLHPAVHPTLKPILKHPEETVILLPQHNHLNANTNNLDIHNLPPNNFNRASESRSEILGSDWLSNLLMRKVAQTEALRLAQARAVQAQVNEAHQREQHILQQEQVHPMVHQQILK